MCHQKKPTPSFFLVSLFSNTQRLAHFLAVFFAGSRCLARCFALAAGLRGGVFPPEFLNFFWRFPLNEGTLSVPYVDDLSIFFFNLSVCRTSSGFPENSG